MRIAVISDIHANLEAFEQVLIDIGKSDIDTTVCLGDNIGYGPDPEPVVSLIRDRDIPSVMGNHELAVIDQKFLTWFNPLARRSLLKTIDMLSEETIRFIYGLKPFMIYDEYRFVHGFPPDSATTYLFQVAEDELLHTFNQMKERICFLGHTHRLEIIGFNGRSITRSRLTQNVINLTVPTVTSLTPGVSDSQETVIITPNMLSWIQGKTASKSNSYRMILLRL